MVMKNIKLNWKKKYLSDKSGFWHEAEVKPIGWSYVVDCIYNQDKFGCYLFVNTFADEVEIAKKKFKTLEAAQKECENHLTKTYKQFQKFIDSNTYE
jgi:hypothetical protein